MKSSIRFALVFSGIVCLVTSAISQEISQTDSSKAGADFPIQGEYLGTVAVNSGKAIFGVQVVAKGDGKFMVKMHNGGLPGQEGYQPSSKPIVLDAATKDGKVQIQGKDFSGSIENGKLTLNGSVLSKTERQSPTLSKTPPSGAVVLFDGKTAEEWNNGKLMEGNLLNNGITTKKSFGNHSMHLEFRLPYMPKASGQGRGNSGLYLQNRYEVQILDSFGLEGKNNECGGIYTQYAPTVNACLPPLVWQTYDIDFVAAKFDASGKKISDAEATIYHNGIKIHDKIKFKGPTGGGKPESKENGPFQLQNHGNPVYFRNIWVVEK